MKSAPVVLFVYRRPDHTRRTVEALQQNEGVAETDLVIFSDGPKDVASHDAVASVRKYCEEIRGFRSIQLVKRESNSGLARSVISGVSQILKERGVAIIVEDDIVTSRYFLRFMNDALRTYQRQPQIMSITGLNFPIKPSFFYRNDVYLSHRSSSWGWATWEDRWSKVDWEVSDYDQFRSSPFAQGQFNRGGADLTAMLEMQMEGKVDSWAIRWAYAHFRADAYCVFPLKSLVLNIGLDGTGTHCPRIDKSQLDYLKPMQEYQITFPFPLQPDRTMLRRFLAYQNSASGRKAPSFVKRRLRSLASRIIDKTYQKYPAIFPVNALVQILNDKHGHRQSKKAGLPVDLANKPIPWFTYPAIEYLEQLDFSEKVFFEWGSGNSSKYFAARAKSITSVEASEEWYNKGKMSLAGNQVLLLKTGADYINAIKSMGNSFDVIIIDGILRDGCAELAPAYLKPGGMIIYDNSDREPLVCKGLREKGFVQIDFHGFGPVNDYSWTTSLFFKEFVFTPITDQPLIPKGGGF